MYADILQMHTWRELHTKYVPTYVHNMLPVFCCQMFCLEWTTCLWILDLWCTLPIEPPSQLILQQSIEQLSWQFEVRSKLMYIACKYACTYIHLNIKYTYTYISTYTTLLKLRLLLHVCSIIIKISHMHSTKDLHTYTRMYVYMHMHQRTVYRVDTQILYIQIFFWLLFQLRWKCLPLVVNNYITPVEDRNTPTGGKSQ